MNERLRDAAETVVDDHETRSGEYDSLVYPTAYARMRGLIDDGRTSFDDFGGSAE
jgi:hypothetical protein